ncbi:SAF domain-containing protein [Amycolatopsis rhabdoformis]|uniref:SAF domain-containing protein n=1 Tax=Amycolatopsis rhabdoformis TaxID=1448059 RepID=UPI0038995B06
MLNRLTELHLLRGRRVRLLRRFLAAALLLAGLLVALHPASARGAPSTATVVSARDLPAGSVLRAADLRLTDLPDDLRPAGALGRLDTAVGRLLSGAARAGEPLTDVRLLGVALPAKGDSGVVTVAVRLADADVAELLRPGQHVGVVAAPDATHASAELVKDATVVTVHRAEGRGLGVDKGPLVLLALPVSVATEVAATSLERPVTVTLR